MDLIGSVKHLENRLDGRKPNQGKGRLVPKRVRDLAVDDTNAPAAANPSSTEHDTPLGGQVDTAA